MQETPSSLVTSLQSTVGERNMKILKSNLAQTGLQKRSNEKKPAKRTSHNPVVSKFDLMSEFSSGIDFSKPKVQKLS